MEVLPYSGPPIIPPGQDITFSTPSGDKVQAPAMYFVAALLQLLGPQELAFVCSTVEGLMRQANPLRGGLGHKKTISGSGPNGQIKLL